MRHCPDGRSTTRQYGQSVDREDRRVPTVRRGGILRRSPVGPDHRLYLCDRLLSATSTQQATVGDGAVRLRHGDHERIRRPRGQRIDDLADQQSAGGAGDDRDEHVQQRDRDRCGWTCTATRLPRQRP